MDEMTHDYRRTAEAEREDDAEFGDMGRSPDVLPGAGIIIAMLINVALIGAGAWLAFG